MAMIISVLVSISRTETIEAFHAYKKSALFSWLMEASHALVFVYLTAL